MMLSIEFVNDCTGTQLKGNYDYRVKINGQIIDSGRVENHYRYKGWQGLIKKLAKQVKAKTGEELEVYKVCFPE